ncbi:MAG: NAD(P)/FAD-dependent oxidoreductase [Bacteroidia bacterium]|nr:NAD(P)/FAD-dependent oxidoreductase [Bacteroidia bacterium]
MENWDIITIGGGAAGFFASIQAAEANPNLKILILEGSNSVLDKVKISGGGRCNVTHACWEPAELVKFYPRGGKALRGPFHSFCTGDTVAWFESRGVPLKIEEDGRMFPVSDSSQSIMDALMGAVANAKTEVRTSHRVKDIQVEEEGFTLECGEGRTFHTRRLMVASGSVPAMWKILQKLGHTIGEPVPSLFTFNIRDERIADLPGLSVPEAVVSVVGTHLTSTGPLLITHWGMSGPAILKLSAWGARELHALKYDFSIQINWVGGMKLQMVEEQLRSAKRNLARKKVQTAPQFQLPRRLWQKLCEAAFIFPDLNWADLTAGQLLALAQELTQGQFQVRGKSTFKEEFVTAGGVELDEINFKRFESKLIPGLFMAGEVLNIDAVTGGFNFQAAWTGGYLAGQALSQD